jgi:peptide/nickel transport system permease protein
VSVDVTADASEVPARRSASQAWRRLRSDSSAVVGAVLILVFLVVAVAAPVITAIAGTDPYTYHLDALTGSGSPRGTAGGISGAHWFGVEPLTGRDLFAIVVYGARTSFLIGLTATVFATLLGVVVGVTAGYFGGWYDRVVSRVIDVLFGFPALVFMIALGVIAPPWIPRPLLIVAVIGFFGWPRPARVIRAQTMSLKQRNFVLASTAMGSGSMHVVVRQLLPNLVPTVMVFVTITIPYSIGVEAALSFLGVGVPPPTPSWGRSIGDAIDWVQTDPAYLVFPGMALFLITLAFNLFGDALRDALDTRSRGLRS